MFKKMLSMVCIMLLCAVCMPALASAAFDPVDSASDGICNDPENASSAACVSSSPDKNPISGKNGILLKAVDIVAYVAGIAAVIVIIYSGIKLATSRGDSQKISNARGTLQDAIVGIIIILIAHSLLTGFIVQLSK